MSLPVLGAASPSGAVIRRSRSGRRRATVLAAVQLLMIAHVVLWLLSREHGWFGGRTTTPVEPSESMEFVKDGLVNAGLLFFAASLLATLVLGRWFCGWGCHVVMLQDLCGWIMKRLGVRPKAFRSRLLLYVPLILALYMFVWPAAYRAGHWAARQAGWIDSSLPAWHASVSLTTEQFWKTFPGVLVAVPFLLVCGFATVYFLGAKGFCTYGCPYGGFFAPIDRLAPGRIRVTDDCEQCGHCTAVCTSNVRVHEEVREYGMVVDPGCMKCLDCVSVCPKGALYFGLGRPAAVKGPPRHQAPARRHDLTWPEEIGLFAFFWLAFVSVRGAYNLVPMLFAAGLAGCLTFIAWKLWRLRRDANVNLHRFRLKHRGRLQPGGALFVAASALTLLLGAQAGTAGLMRFAGDWVVRSIDAAPGGSGGPAVVDEENRARAERAVALYTLASGMRDGGTGLRGNVNVDASLVNLHLALDQPGQAESVLRRALRDHGLQEPLCRQLVALLGAQGRHAEASELFRGLLHEERDVPLLLDDFVQWCDEQGRLSEAVEVVRTRLARFPRDYPTLRWLSLLLMQTGAADEGIALLRRRVDMRPRDPEALINLGLALGGRRDLAGALELTRRAYEIAPQRADVALQLSGMLQALGQREEALSVLQPALARWPAHASLHLQAASVLRELDRLPESAAHLRRYEELTGRAP